MPLANCMVSKKDCKNHLINFKWNSFMHNSLLILSWFFNFHLLWRYSVIIKLLLTSFVITCDGSASKSHLLFRNDSHALQIHFYHDDLEICNRLGSKATIHNLGKWNLKMYKKRSAFYDYFHACIVCAYIQESLILGILIRVFGLPSIASN